MRYSYNYDGWIIHGIAEAFEEDLALRIRAKAHLDYLTDGFVRMTVGRDHGLMDKQVPCMSL